jgi:hypothetical protein
MNHNELAALLAMAQLDCRHPREQLRYLLRAEAERRGMLRVFHQIEQTEGAPTDQDDAPPREA